MQIYFEDNILAVSYFNFKIHLCSRSYNKLLATQLQVLHGQLKIPIREELRKYRLQGMVGVDVDVAEYRVFL